MTMAKETINKASETAFWLTHPDQTQAAVHMALQWLAYVYPASELQIDRTLKTALPYADMDLSSRWAQFLDEQDVDEHVDALRWVADTLSNEQIPFLVETCWRLLLVDHELPNHVPLALRIVGQVLNVNDHEVMSIGEEVYAEYVESDDSSHQRLPLLPVDPRYLDRIEWRLHGHGATQRTYAQRTPNPKKKSHKQGWTGFAFGVVVGVVATIALVFGPLNLGRVRVPVYLYEFGSSESELTSTPADAVTAPAVEVPEVIEIVTVTENSVANAEAVTETEIVESASPEAEAPAELLVEEEAPVVIEPPVVEGSLDSAEAIVAVTPALVANPGQRVLMEVTATILNVRSAPDTNAVVLIKLAEGARVWAYPEQAVGNWMMVRVEGEQGYASASFLEALP